MKKVFENNVDEWEIKPYKLKYKTAFFTFHIIISYFARALLSKKFAEKCEVLKNLQKGKKEFFLQSKKKRCMWKITCLDKRAESCKD